MKIGLFYLITLIVLLTVPAISVSNFAYGDHQYSLQPTTDNGMLVIANGRAEYGRYWRWFPPGYVDKPQLMAESINVFMHWGDEISNLYTSRGKSVYKLYSYNWISQHSSSTYNDLEDTIYDKIDEYSYHWDLILMIGHANPFAWEAYYWNHNHVTYYTTGWLIPDNNNWAPSTSDVIASIYASDVRNELSDNSWYYLPHIVFMIGCDSLDKLTEEGGWAWGYRLSAQDYYSGDWILRGIVGFQGPVYYNWLTGDFQAANLAKKMIEYMNNGYSAITAFKKASQDTGFPYKIYQSPTSSSIGENNGDSYAVYIGDDAWQDPSNKDVALRTSLDFMKTYMPKMYSLVVNESVSPVITDKSDRWYAELIDRPVYSVYWKIPYNPPKYGNVTYIFEVDMTIIVDNGAGIVESVSLIGSIYENPKLLEQYTQEDLLKMENEVGEYMSSDIGILETYALNQLNNTPSIISLKLVNNDTQNKIYYIMQNKLNAPIYVNETFYIHPLTIEIINTGRSFMYENQIPYLAKYMDQLGSLSGNIISYNEASKIFNKTLATMNGKYEVKRNLTLIILIDPGTHRVTPYYFSEVNGLKGREFIFINAYTGKVKTFPLDEAYLHLLPRDDNVKTLELTALFTVTAIVVVLAVYYGLRAGRKQK